MVPSETISTNIDDCNCNIANKWVPHLFWATQLRQLSQWHYAYMISLCKPYTFPNFFQSFCTKMVRKNFGTPKGQNFVFLFLKTTLVRKNWKKLRIPKIWHSNVLPRWSKWEIKTLYAWYLNILLFISTRSPWHKFKLSPLNHICWGNQNEGQQPILTRHLNKL